MHKALDIYLNNEGFENKGLDCIELPIAYGASYFGKTYEEEGYNTYYLAYAYYCAVYNNWPDNKYESYVEHQNTLLAYLGLEMVEIPIYSKIDFFEKIQSGINSGCPIMMALCYYDLFYCWFMYKKYKIGHGVLVSEYNSIRHTYILREGVHVSMAGPLYRFQISEEILYDLWEKSNKTFGRENNSIFYIRKIADKDNSSLLFLLEDFITKKYTLRENALCRLMLNYNDQMETFTSDSMQKSLIMHYVEGIGMLFHILDRVAKSIDTDIDLKWVATIKERCIQQRFQLINVLVIHACQSKELSEKRTEILTQKMIIDDQLIYDTVYRVYEKLCLPKNEMLNDV